MREHDTIAAPATPPTPAPRAIVRTSGPSVFELLATLAAGDRPAHASAVERLLDLAPGIVVAATIYAFVGPRSSTGEDVVEYHLPGSPLFVRLLLSRLFERGARLAEPGEFTARAFFNGRLDLARAEGVAATIAAASRQELDAARQLLAGELSRRLAPIVATAVDALASVEADLDFADEPVDALAAEAVDARIEAIDASLAALLRSSARIERLQQEPRIVFSGPPNAGKSSLVNALAGIDRAVVSDVAGTTRDPLSTRVALRRGHVTLVDTAGLEADAEGAIDRQMQSAARDERARADVRVLVRPAGESGRDVDEAQADLIVRSKVDLARPTADGIGVSVVTGDGLAALRERLDALAFGSKGGGQSLALNTRHVALLEAARAALADARSASAMGPEFVAAAMRRSLDALGGVGGAVTPDDVLGKIFGSFCIGK